MNLDSFLSDTRDQLEQALTKSFQACTFAPLTHAVHYSLLDGGKRLRPALVRAAAQCAEQHSALWLTPAQALEMIHVYSLIHDDLPAMDNDDLRRGRLTNHKKFDEATAILAGDALQTEAFSIIANDTQLTDRQVRTMTVQLSHAAGANGMVAGQMIDLASEQKALTVDELAHLHSLKTGALIRASLRLGALCNPQVSGSLLAQLDIYGTAIGLAFQITDDILDVTSSTEVLGKPQGSDLAAQKSTYVSLLGIEGAQQKAQEQAGLARAALTELGMDSESILWQLIDYVIDRHY